MNRRGFLKTTCATIGAILLGRFIPVKSQDSITKEQIVGDSIAPVHDHDTGAWSDATGSDVLADIRAASTAIREESGIRPTWFVYEGKRYYT